MNLLGVIVVLAFTTTIYAQQVGTLTAETHPLITWSLCTAPGTCTTQVGSVVLDADWRWLHNVGGYTNCFTGNTFDASLCPDPLTCAANCALEGADYSGTYGITTSGNALTLKQPSTPTGGVPGSKVYFLASNTKYYQWKILNREFAFDVDVSRLGCGYNGALYLTSMDADGGMSKYPTNKAGAKYGTGYCDSQCPRNLHFINGQANVLGWQPTSSYGGTGIYGSCCTEMDVWQANYISNAVVAHPCSVSGQSRCSYNQCEGGEEGGVCDADGCDFNPYRNGDHTFYGQGGTVDTTQKFTVVTQFVTSDGTDNGSLAQIRRYYVQNGKVISNTNTNFPGLNKYNSITDQYCDDQKSFFGDPNYFKQYGSLEAVGSAMQNGMVLSLSLSGSFEDDYFWLDSNYPTDAPDPSKPGVARGTCPTSPSGTLPVTGLYPPPQVIFSNIKFGPIGSTSGVAPA